MPIILAWLPSTFHHHSPPNRASFVTTRPWTARAAAAPRYSAVLEAAPDGRRDNAPSCQCRWCGRRMRPLVQVKATAPLVQVKAAAPLAQAKAAAKWRGRA
jgi:hypothetical protein